MSSFLTRIYFSLSVINHVKDGRLDRGKRFQEKGEVLSHYIPKAF